MPQSNQGCGGCGFWIILFALIGLIVTGGAIVALVKLAVVIIALLIPFAIWGVVIIILAMIFGSIFRSR